MEIYLDNAATTRPYPAVNNIIAQINEECYGNPSSLHHMGFLAENAINDARTTIACTIGASAKEIIFTSGGTEGDNLAIIGTTMAYRRRGNHILTTSVEHPAVVEPLKYLAKQGFEVEAVEVDANGVVDADTFVSRVRPDTILISVMYVNNEVGSIQPISRIAYAAKLKTPSVIVHSDAVQAYGKHPIDVALEGIDLLSTSAHKFHGPKGVGFLYKSSKIRLNPIAFGGGHEYGLRPGTENTAGIVGMQAAANAEFADLDTRLTRCVEFKRQLMEGIADIPGVRFFGDEQGSPYILCVGLKAVGSEILLHMLEEKGVYVSSGSACSTHKRADSHVLTAMKVSKDYIRSTVRFSFGTFTTQEEIAAAVAAFRAVKFSG
jgi:cysteine desulfurase